MKGMIIVDLDGALMKSRPFDNAHVKWFGLMANLLNDDSVKQYAETPAYFSYVDNVMKRYLGDVDHDTRNRFARAVYSMVIIAETGKEDLFSEFAEYLKSIKDKHMIALVTTSPEDSIKAVLEKVGCGDLFDIVMSSPMGERPDKQKLFSSFTEKYGKPEFYIGYGDEDLQAISEKGVKTISVSWIKKGRFRGDFDIGSVKELSEIIKG